MTEQTQILQRHLECISKDLITLDGKRRWVPLFTGVVMIDLRTAFDVVDHKLLLKKLQVYGLNTISLKWFQSYLSGGYQKVCVDGKLSAPRVIHSGVLQGSILGPALHE